ncbi:MAG TPA: ThuA domain-containing protein [Urbifossiella sp.]|jgi:type 1 glutamine amidotransferase|nr:ThuA domain-containing protein [Urbifossiella sp.]
MRPLPVLLALLFVFPVLAAAPQHPAGYKLEQPPADPAAAKIVLVGGSNYFKAGEHDYLAGCAVLADLLKQTPGVAPVLAADWPTKAETFAHAKAVVLFVDGGDKHPVLKGNRAAEVQKLVDAGVGLVQLHQVADYPKEFGDRARAWAGGAWEKGTGQRAHWVHTFKTFPDHPVCRGVTPFTIDDGWLYKNRFAEGKAGVTPLLRTVNPKEKASEAQDGAIVAWAFERPEGKGRSFTFTGAHLHASFAEEGYRRLLVNSILWTAGLEVPTTGAPVRLEVAALPDYLTPPPAKK